MDNNDLEKLKLLSNNLKDYFNALLIKLRKNAIENNHDMSYFISDQYWVGPRSCSVEIHTAYCKKCSFELEAEYRIYRNDEAVYIDFLRSDIKCNR